MEALGFGGKTEKENAILRGRVNFSGSNVTVPIEICIVIIDMCAGVLSETNRTRPLFKGSHEY